MILAGDIGGTNARLGLFTSQEGALAAVTTHQYPTQDFESLEKIVTCFLNEYGDEITCACFGVAGPVIGGRSQGVNMAWPVDGTSLADTLSGIPVTVINDLVANANGLTRLASQDYRTIQEGEANPQGNIAILAAGTGLGVASVNRSDGKNRISPSEGGHSDFAAQSDEDIALLHFLRKQFGHVSWERVVSGSGLCHLYEFLRAREPDREPSWLRDALAEGDRAACIAKHGQDGSSDLCRLALLRFAHYYGSLAGNLALQLYTTGGIWLGGGIPSKLSDILTEPTFLDAFLGKGRIQYLLEVIPVHVVLNEHTALLGAAQWAAASTGTP
ncbi:MAG: glucokinase [Planctomycetota bacterium]|nr:glucokinase [Planctomycetota bacterium]